MTYTHKLPTLCSATLTLCELDYVTADLYHAEWPNKPRIIWHNLQNKHAVISLLARTQVYSVCLHLEQIFEAVLEEMKLVLQLYVYVKLSKNQSWVNLLFSASRDLIHDSFLDSSFSISNRVKNRDLQWTVNLLLNRTVHKSYVKYMLSNSFSS